MSSTKQRIILYIAPVALLLAILACATATADNVSILDMPQFVCATSTPYATHTQAPTQIHPATHIPPSGYATYTPIPGCIWNGAVCATSTPYPGGVYTTPGHTIPGPTSTPRPTLTPWPTPTPYVVSGGFHLGADVYAGSADSALHLRLRLDDIAVYPVDDEQQVVTWQVEIENVGPVTYYTLPGGQIFVAEVMTVTGAYSGQWWASQEAATTAGITLEPVALDVLEVQPGYTYALTLTAFTPVGEPARIGWILDPLGGGHDGDMFGGNVAYWLTDANPACSGNPAPGATLPSPLAPPSATPSRTPQFPPWCTWCSD